MINLWEFGPGSKFETVDGAVAEVVSGTEDGEWVKVRYLRCDDRPALVGTEDLCHESEVSHTVAL